MHIYIYIYINITNSHVWTGPGSGKRARRGVPLQPRCGFKRHLLAPHIHFKHQIRDGNWSPLSQNQWTRWIMCGHQPSRPFDQSQMSLGRWGGPGTRARRGAPLQPRLIILKALSSEVLPNPKPQVLNLKPKIPNPKCSTKILNTQILNP